MAKKLVPIVEIIAADDEWTCDMHCFVCINAMLLVRTEHGFDVLLGLPEMAPDELTANFLHDGYCYYLDKYLKNVNEFFDINKKN